MPKRPRGDGSPDRLKNYARHDERDSAGGAMSEGSDTEDMIAAGIASDDSDTDDESPAHGRAPAAEPLFIAQARAQLDAARRAAAMRTPVRPPVLHHMNRDAPEATPPARERGVAAAVFGSAVSIGSARSGVSAGASDVREPLHASGAGRVFAITPLAGAPMPRPDIAASATRINLATGGRLDLAAVPIGSLEL